MRQMIRTLTLLTVIAFAFTITATAQLTTSAIRGQVEYNDESLPGATVVLKHLPTGATYGTTTNLSGIYNLSNLNPGGPYTLTISFIGYDSYIKEELFLSLGQTLQLNAKLSETSSELAEILILGRTSGVFDGNTTGSKTTVSNELINNMPSISRGISDFARLTPQAKINADGGLEIAGQNSRYNSFTIDGAVQNDVFGLANNGTNGGQIGINPMSIDIIDQLTISLSPYDVTQSGFSGAGINAVTKSGSNTFKGSAYNYFRNQELAGKTPTDKADVDRVKLDEFTSNTTGISLGGPIIKNKLFLFANAEIQRDNTPKPYDFANYSGSATKSDVESLASKLKNDYNYDPGTFENTMATLNAEKFFVKLDWNINNRNKFSVRHQYSKGRSISPSTSSKTNINFSNSGVDFLSTTNTTTAELKSIIGNKFANKLLVGVNIVDDNREPMGERFPYVYLSNERISLGSEQFSTANRLKQTVISFTDDFSIYSGKHNITLGMHHEYYDMFNVFIRQNFGSFNYQSLSDFINGMPATQYDRTFSNVDNIAGDETDAAADFRVLQLGFYAQDDYQISNKLNLTFGVRVDLPMYLNTPAENTDFNNNVIPHLESKYDIDMMGAKTGQMPETSPLLSPRAGFNWDINGDKTLQLRGGVGLFTSRIPYVWPGGSYNNNGITLGAMRVKQRDNTDAPELLFNSEWDNQPKVSGKPSGQIDIFAKDFKMPQVLRANLAVDKKLNNGITTTFDVTYTKNVNNVTYQNLLIYDDGTKLTGTGDSRPIWKSIANDVNAQAEGSYTGIFLGSNTNEGHSFNIMGQAEKNWNNGLYASLAYNYGVSKSINDGVSSQNSSQWRVANTYGRNNLDLGYSVFDLGHRVIANIAYKWEYSKVANSTISVFYNGQSGQRFSYGYDNGSVYEGPIGDNNDGKSLTLIYIPKDQNDIKLVDVVTNNEVSYSAEQQWADLNNFIEGNSYLKSNRGKYSERHPQRMPFENIIDLKFVQEFKFKVSSDYENRIQIGLDIFNFTNMLNKDWGRMHNALGDYNVYRLLRFAGYENDKSTPTYQYVNKEDTKTWGIDDSGLQSSRWQAQLSVRYIF